MSIQNCYIKKWKIIKVEIKMIKTIGYWLTTLALVEKENSVIGMD